MDNIWAVIVPNDQTYDPFLKKLFTSRKELEAHIKHMDNHRKYNIDGEVIYEDGKEIAEIREVSLEKILKEGLFYQS